VSDIIFDDELKGKLRKMEKWGEYLDEFSRVISSGVWNHTVGIGMFQLNSQ
jgi:hypothetical protein